MVLRARAPPCQPCSCSTPTADCLLCFVSSCRHVPVPAPTPPATTDVLHPHRRSQARVTERSRAPKPRVPNFTAAYIEQDEEEDGGDYFAAGGDDDDDDDGYNRRGRDDEEVSGVVTLGFGQGEEAADGCQLRVTTAGSGVVLEPAVLGWSCA